MKVRDVIAIDDSSLQTKSIYLILDMTDEKLYALKLKKNKNSFTPTNTLSEFSINKLKNYPTQVITNKFESKLKNFKHVIYDKFGVPWFVDFSQK